MFTKVWDNKKIALLKKHYGKMSLNELQQKYFPDRSLEALRSRARMLKISKNIKKALPKKWTKKEENILIKLYKNKSVSEIMKYLPGRSSLSIRLKIHGLMTNGKIERKKGLSFSPKEDKIIINNFKTHSAKEISKLLDRTCCSVTYRIRILQLKGLLDYKGHRKEKNND